MRSSRKHLQLLRAARCTVVVLQVYNEGVRDLLQRGDAGKARLPVFEDELEGYMVRACGHQPRHATQLCRPPFGTSCTNAALWSALCRGRHVGGWGAHACGAQVSGLSYRQIKSEAELRTCFNSGRLARDMGSTDLGSVHERAAGLFTVHLAQYAPAAVPGEEDRIMVRGARVWRRFGGELRRTQRSELALRREDAPQRWA